MSRKTTNDGNRKRRTTWLHCVLWITWRMFRTTPSTLPPLMWIAMMVVVQTFRRCMRILRSVIRGRHWITRTTNHIMSEERQRNGRKIARRIKQQLYQTVVVTMTKNMTIRLQMSLCHVHQSFWISWKVHRKNQHFQSYRWIRMTMIIRTEKKVPSLNRYNMKRLIFCQNSLSIVHFQRLLVVWLYHSSNEIYNDVRGVCLS